MFPPGSEAAIPIDESSPGWTEDLEDLFVRGIKPLHAHRRLWLVLPRTILHAVIYITYNT